MAEKNTITRADLSEAMISSFGVLPQRAKENIDGDHLAKYIETICVKLGFPAAGSTSKQNTNE